MAAPNISNLSAAQGTGVAPQPRASVIDLAVTFTSDAGTADFEVEISLNDGASWFACTLHAAGNGQGLAAGTRHLYVANAPTFADHGLPDHDGDARVRVRGTNGDGTSGWTTSGVVALKTTKPSPAAATMAAHVGSPDRSASVDADVTFGVTSGDAAWYRISRDVEDLDEDGAAEHLAYANPGTFTFTNDPDHNDAHQEIYVRIYDQYYNAAPAVLVFADPGAGIPDGLPWWQWTPPTNVIVSLVGTAGEEPYTGIRIEPDGSFTPDRDVTVNAYAHSPIPLQWQVLDTSDAEQGGDGPSADATRQASVGVWFDYDPEDTATTMELIRLRTNAADPAANDYNHDAPCSVLVRFRDAAGNTTDAGEATIRLNTRVHLTPEKPLDPDDPNRFLFEIVGGALVPIPREEASADELDRSWGDIFFPLSHRYLIGPDGELDVDATLSRQSSFATNIFYYNAPQPDFDWPLLKNRQSTTLPNGVSGFYFTAVDYDADGRVQLGQWTDDGSKDYPPMQSADPGSLASWVIDNRGYGDFALEFERFDLNPGIYGPPHNITAPYKGDVLVVYDASAEGATEPYIDATGRQRLRIADSSLLRELHAYTGGGTGVVDLATGSLAGSNANGTFTTPLVRGVGVVALVLYSDTAGSASGFKLKAGPSRTKYWRNWDVDPASGEVWIHRHSKYGGPAGSSGTNEYRMQYQFLDADVTFDLEAGEVIFAQGQGGRAVTADYSYVSEEAPGVRTYIARWDDFVASLDALAFVGEAGSAQPTSEIKAEDYAGPGTAGRVLTGGAWNKDRGVLTFDAGQAPDAGQRVWGSYTHHTFKRLTGDGTGDIEYFPRVVVADNTEVLPDYAWADLKITNEGDATLEGGLFKFGFRGTDSGATGVPEFDEGTVIDQVWDRNRPWDVQQGTAQETYERMAGYARDTYEPWNTAVCHRLRSDYPSGNDAQGVDMREYMTAQGIFQENPPNQGVDLGNLGPADVKYLRAVWALGGSSMTGYPAQKTAGEKRCSAEIGGTYYDLTIF